MQSSAESTAKVAEHPQRARLIPVSRDDLERVLPTLVPWIEKAISKDERQDVETVLEALRRFEMQAWLGWVPATNELVVCLLTELIDYPRKRALVCDFVAANKPPREWLHLFQDVKEYARAAGCNQIETHHRFERAMRLRNRVFVEDL